MTVKEVFDLRKQGKIEEAYEAIRPMYAAHKGRYTTLCMFWTAADVFKLRLEQKRVEEAEKILEALKRMLPRVEAINKELDSQNATAPAPAKPKAETKYPWEKAEAQQEGSSASAFLASATRRLAKAQTTHSTHSPHPAPSAPITPSSRSVLTGSTGEKEAPTNSQLLHDYPGRLIVSLDEGIIRPIEGINAPQRVVLACITAHPGYSVPQISESTGIPQKSIERHVSALINRDLIEHRGSKKTGGYYAK